MTPLSRREFIASSAVAACASSFAAPVPVTPRKLPGVDELPAFRAFRPSAVLSAVIALQEAGREASFNHLTSLADLSEAAKKHEAALEKTGLEGERLKLAVARALLEELYRRRGVILLCRMLFVAKPGKKFRRPGLGGPYFVGGNHRTEWPLEPIEIVDGVPFLVTQGYLLGGLAEFPADYLEYCVKECEWNPTRFKPKTAAEMKKALDKLIGFLEHGGRLHDHDRELLHKQLT